MMSVLEYAQDVNKTVKQILDRVLEINISDDIYNELEKIIGE